MGESIPALIAAYEEHVNDLEDRVANLAADLLEARAQRHELAKRCEGYETAIAEFTRELDEARSAAQFDRVSREAAEDDRDEARHGERVAWVEVERLRKELAEKGLKP